jgi:hypothetical protein
MGYLFRKNFLMSLSDDILFKLTIISEGSDYSSGVVKTLGRIKKFCNKTTGTYNSWIYKESVYFLEWPYTDDDKVLYGNVYEKVGASSRLIGEYKISSEGKILDFPFFPRSIRHKINEQ